MSDLHRLYWDTPAMLGPYAQYFLISEVDERGCCTMLHPLVCLRKKKVDTPNGPELALRTAPIGESYFLPTDRRDRPRLPA